MTIAAGTFVAANNANPVASSVDVSITVGAGDAVYIGTAVSADDTFALSCTVFPGGSPPTLTQIGSTIVDTVGNEKYTHWYAQNLAAGSYTFQWAGTPVGNSWPDLFALQITGGVTAGIVVANGPGQYQSSPPTTPDFLTSGTPQTPSSYPVLVVGFSCDSQTLATPAPGTGFSSVGTCFDFGFGNGGIVLVSSATVASGTVQMLATATGSGTECVTMMAAFLEAGGATDPRSALAFGPIGMQ